MLGQLCELRLPLCEPVLLPLWELLVLGVVAVLLVVLELVVLDELDALAIAAPPPITAPVIASIVSAAVILRRIWPHLLSVVRLGGLAGRSSWEVGESSDDAKNQ
jgi:hypothetical protein